MSLLRSRTVQPPTSYIRRRDRGRYEGFPDLSTCWEQSDEHRRYFLRYLDCAERSRYHEQQAACLPFDNIVAGFAGEQYRRTFFAHYRVRGRKPDPHVYLEGLVDDPLLPRLALLTIERKPRSLLDSIPPNYEGWLEHFTIQAAVAIVFPEEKRLIQNAIERCIERRIFFRNACVRSCNKRIATDSHDTFLLILQILRARLIYYNENY